MAASPQESCLSRSFGTRLCDRCGECITSYCPTVQSFSALGSFADDSKEQRVARLAAWEGVDPALVRQYYEHRMVAECQPKVAFCAFCGGQLRTWRARQCRHCLADWH